VGLSQCRNKANYAVYLKPFEENNNQHPSGGCLDSDCGDNTELQKRYSVICNVSPFIGRP
jgi:hypothetical protein